MIQYTHASLANLINEKVLVFGFCNTQASFFSKH